MNKDCFWCSSEEGSCSCTYYCGSMLCRAVYGGNYYFGDRR